MGASLAAVGIGHGLAVAQAPAGAAEEAPAGGEPTGGAQAGSGDPTPPGAPGPGADPGSGMSPDQKVAAGEQFITGMESVRQQIRVELEESRQRRDVVKTLCLNDKLNQIDVTLRSAGERSRALKSAASAGDNGQASHEFTIMSVLNQRGQQLDAEAKQCVGKEVGMVGESSASMEVNPNLPLEDPTELRNPTLIVEPPQCASCFR